MTVLADTHMHTAYSDAVGTIEENAAAAEALGLRTIACTDHFTYEEGTFKANRFCIDLDQHESYFADIRAARERHPRLNIVTGFECDYYPGCEDYIAAHCEDEVTFRLGSVHFIDGLTVESHDETDLFLGYGINETWRRFVETWCDACESSAGFDSMAHPDIFRRGGYATTCDLAPGYRQMAEAAHDNGRHIEINTSGFNHVTKDFYPTRMLLDEFERAEVPITVASDAHVKTRVGDKIAEAYEYAFKAGYRSFDVPVVGGGFETFSL